MDNFRDSQWEADFRTAYAELCGKPQLLLPAPRPELYDMDNIHDVVPLPLSPYSVPVEEHTFDPDCRADVLAKIRIVKTPRPGLCAVMFDGCLLGKIAKSPWTVGWVSERSRTRLYFNREDAALSLLEGSALDVEALR